MAVTQSHLEVKIFVDKEKSRVLFAEADAEFVDVLFSFLTLPLGTIVRLIGKTKSEPATVGCFSTLYQSVMSLGNEHFLSEGFKDMLLHPRSSSECHCRRLKINVDDSKADYFICGSYMRVCYPFMSMYKNALCPYCKRVLSPYKQSEDSKYISKGNVFVTQDSKFIISDDLQVIPVVPGAVIGLLSNLGVSDMNVIEERTVKLGLNEVLELLKLTLLSTTPLTDLSLSKTKQPVPRKLSGQKRRCVGHSPDGEDKKMNVKVLLNKSNKQVVFVEAYRDFIDFLFSFLIIPLGQLLHIMDGQLCLGSIDGLYKSVLSLDSQYFVSKDLKNILIRPKLAPHFNRVNNMFPLESTSVGCYINGMMRTMPVHIKLKGVEGSGGFLREEAMFLVTNDLSVVPFSEDASAISVYKRFNISALDLEEKTISLGMTEGISILRSSLTSTSAISNGLLHNSLIFQEPKQEK